MVQIKIALLPIVLFALTIILAFSFFSNANLAYAHITKKFGNITLEVGWSNEPILVGELNNVIIQVNQTSGGKNNNSTAVVNALAGMNIMVKYGGATKPLDFVPSEVTEGLYNGRMIPTRIGSYSLVMNGTIQGQKFNNTEIPLDLVEGKEKISFPDTSSSAIGGGVDIATANNNIGPRLQGIVSQLANDIDSAKGGIGVIAKSNADTQKSIQNLKGAADRSYMIGLGGIGAGVAGIIIAAVALSRKEAPNASS